MALSQSNLKSALQTIFEDLGTSKTASQAADEMATAIHSYVTDAIATVTVPVGTFLVAAPGGTPNPAPIPVVGDPGAGTGGLS